MESELGQTLKPLDTTGPAHIVAERWRKWKRSFEYYIAGRGITDKARCTALLLHLAGERVQDIFDSLRADLDPDAADPFKETLQALDNYFKIDANEPYERHVFRQMTQMEHETVSQYATRLRNQAVFCNFKDDQDQIRDQFDSIYD